MEFSSQRVKKKLNNETNKKKHHLKRFKQNINNKTKFCLNRIMFKGISWGNIGIYYSNELFGYAIMAANRTNLSIKDRERESDNLIIFSQK